MKTKIMRCSECKQYTEHEIFGSPYKPEAAFTECLVCHTAWEILDPDAKEFFRSQSY